MISIIIPTNRPDEQISKCLDSIKENTPQSHEVILVREGTMNEAANIGANQAKGEYMVFLHDDIEVLPGWLDEVAEIGGFNYGEHGGQFWVWGGKGDGYCTEGNPDYTAFLMLSQDAFKKIGPFDEHYTAPGYQDTDYGMRIKELGLEITPLSGKIIHHHFRTSPLSSENELYFKQKWHANK